MNGDKALKICLLVRAHRKSEHAVLFERMDFVTYSGMNKIIFKICIKEYINVLIVDVL